VLSPCVDTFAVQGRYGNTGRLLAIQIDAAINSGNSGGPAFADIQSGKVAGGVANVLVVLCHAVTHCCPHVVVWDCHNRLLLLSSFTRAYLIACLLIILSCPLPCPYPYHPCSPPSGVAFSKSIQSNADNIGYIIPYCVVEHFLSEYLAHGSYNGIVGVGFYTQVCRQTG
jgi:hypothetical protein